MRARTILVDGASKVFAMTGYRMGYLAASPDLARTVGNLQSQVSGCPNYISQRAFEACLNEEPEEVEGMIATFDRRRRIIVATEWSLVYRLQTQYPDREFVMADGCIGCRLHCPYMKMIDLPAVKRSLENDTFEIEVDPEVAEGARRSLERMLAVPRDS